MDPEILNKLKEEMTQYLMMAGSSEGDGEQSDDINLSDINLDSFSPEESLNKYLEIFESEFNICTDLYKNGIDSESEIQINFIENQLRRRTEDKAVQVDIGKEYGGIFDDDDSELDLSELQSWTLDIIEIYFSKINQRLDRIEKHIKKIDVTSCNARKRKLVRKQRLYLKMLKRMLERTSDVIQDGEFDTEQQHNLDVRLGEQYQRLNDIFDNSVYYHGIRI